MFPDHGHPLSWYEYAESINPENHNIAAAAKKKIDSDVRQASAAAMTEYDKKRKCVELETGGKGKVDSDLFYNKERSYP